jgi:hypothetical protein
LINQKKGLPMAAMFVSKSGQNEQSWRTFHRCFLQGFGSFGKAVAEENILRNRPSFHLDWKKNMVAMGNLVSD